MLLALTAACGNGLQPPDPAAAILGVWVGESYNGSPIPGPVWIRYQTLVASSGIFPDSTLQELNAFEVELMAAGQCRTTQEWTGKPSTAGCTYDSVENGAVNTITITGEVTADDRIDGTVEGNMMTLHIEGFHYEMFAGPDNVLVLGRRP